MLCTMRPQLRSARPCGAAAPAPRSTLCRAIGTKDLGGKEYAKKLPGISGPFGYFDPFDLAAEVDAEQVKRYREAELTHGRVCMLAAIGFLVGEAVQHKTLFWNWDGNIQGPAIVHFQQTGKGFYEPLLIFIGLAETARVRIGWANPVDKAPFTLRDEYEPGNLGFDPLNLRPREERAYFDLKTRELNNGRLAMIAVAGFVAQELVNGKGIGETLHEKGFF